MNSTSGAPNTTGPIYCFHLSCLQRGFNTCFK